MKHSKHAVIRCQQRGIPKDFIDLIMEFGKPEYKPGGVTEYSINKKDRIKLIAYLKSLTKRLIKIDKQAVLVGDYGTITAYHKKGK